MNCYKLAGSRKFVRWRPLNSLVIKPLQSLPCSSKTCICIGIINHRILSSVGCTRQPTTLLEEPGFLLSADLYPCPCMCGGVPVTDLRCEAALISGVGPFGPSPNQSRCMLVTRLDLVFRDRLHREVSIPAEGALITCPTGRPTSRTQYLRTEPCIYFSTTASLCVSP